MTLDTTGLENSCQIGGQAIGNLAQQQQMANTALSRSVIQQQRERATFGHVLNQIAAGHEQSQYNNLFKHIPVYEEDKDQFFNWLDALESACAYSKHDCHIAAQAKSTGRLRTAILSIGLEQPWSVA